MRFINENPAIASFQSGVGFGDQQRRGADADVRTRIDFENKLLEQKRAMEADKAMREGVMSAYTAQNQPVTQPMPASQQQPTYLPTGPDTGGDTEIGPQVTAIEPPKAGPAAPRAAPASPYGPVMQRMAGAPGTGGSMLNMFSADQKSKAGADVEKRKMQAEANKEFFVAWKTGDPRLAKAINDRFGLGFPEQAFQDRNFVQSMLRISGASKAFLGNNNDAGPDFMKSAIHALAQAKAQGMSIEQAEDYAVQQAAGEMKAQPGFKVQQYLPNEKGEVTAFGQRAGQVQGTGVRARPTATEQRIANPGAFARPGAAGGQSKQEIYMNARINTLVSSGMPLAEAQKIVAGGQSQAFGPKDVARLAQSLMRAVDPNTALPLYKNIQDATAAAQAALGAASGVQQQHAPAQNNDPLGLRR